MACHAHVCGAALDSIAARYAEPRLWLAFVLLEHLVLGAKALLAFGIPDEPQATRDAKEELEWLTRTKLRPSAPLTGDAGDSIRMLQTLA
jgi:hypothetical protein